MEALDPGIGEQDIDAAEFLFGLRCRRAQRRRSRWSTFMPSQRRERPHQPASFLQVLRRRWRNAGTRIDHGTDIDADDVRALAGEGDRRRATNPACGAGDHGDLAPRIPAPNVPSVIADAPVVMNSLLAHPSQREGEASLGSLGAKIASTTIIAIAGKRM